MQSTGKDGDGFQSLPQRYVDNTLVTLRSYVFLILRGWLDGVRWVTEIATTIAPRQPVIVIGTRLQDPKTTKESLALKFNNAYPFHWNSAS